ncbi:MAG: helix-turn-helix domain-containing protein [Gemmatimonadales bacterium]
MKHVAPGAPRSPIEIARDLRRWMRQAGVTQRVMAQRLRVTQPHVSQILAGQFSLESPTVRRFCRMAKVTMTAHRTPLATSPGAERALATAFLDAWDGTREGLRRAEALIRSVAGAIQPTTERKHP